jgi:hypothetical protein
MFDRSKALWRLTERGVAFVEASMIAGLTSLAAGLGAVRAYNLCILALSWLVA